MKTLFTGIAASLLIIGQSIYAQNVGDPAPDFTLNTVDNSTFQLSQHTGTVVMILFFGYGCPHCLAGGPTVQSDIVSVFSSNPSFLAIGVDAWDGTGTQVQSFRNSTGLNMDMCLMGKSLLTTYNLPDWDRIVVVGMDGNIVYKGDNYASQTIKPAKAAIDAALNGTVTSLINTQENNNSITIYPNPVKDFATIGFDLRQPSQVNMQVRSSDGKLVYSIPAEYYAAGKNNITFNAGNLQSGVYYIVLKSADTTEVSKFVVY